METQLIIDWISITSHSPIGWIGSASHPCLDNFDSWELTSGKNGYNEGAKHAMGVSTYRNISRRDMGKHTVYSGKALQKIDHYYNVNPFDILAWHIGKGDNIARIDIAIDFMGYDLKVQQFVDAHEQGLTITKLRQASEIRGVGVDGHTFYIGSTKKRTKLLRIYDKRAESNTVYNWIRAEAQIMGKPATQLSIAMIRGDDIKSVMLGAMFDICDFPTIDVWREVIDGKTDIKLSSHNDKTTNTRQWLDKTVFSSILAEGKNDKDWFDQFITSLLVEIKR